MAVKRLALESLDNFLEMQYEPFIFFPDSIHQLEQFLGELLPLLLRF